MRLAPRPLGNRPPFFALAFSAGPAYKKFFLLSTIRQSHENLIISDGNQYMMVNK
jgi:hypothetical protein